jgi:hypothetical protein
MVPPGSVVRSRLAIVTGGRHGSLLLSGKRGTWLSLPLAFFEHRFLFQRVTHGLQGLLSSFLLTSRLGRVAWVAFALLGKSTHDTLEWHLLLFLCAHFLGSRFQGVVHILLNRYIQRDKQSGTTRNVQENHQNKPSTTSSLLWTQTTLGHVTFFFGLVWAAFF